MIGWGGEVKEAGGRKGGGGGKWHARNGEWYAAGGRGNIEICLAATTIMDSSNAR